MFLDVLAVIAFRSAAAEQTFLQNVILLVPQRDAQADPTLSITKAQQAIFAPAIGATAGMIMRKRVPAFAIRRIILADCAPLSFGQLRAPAFPAVVAFAGCLANEPLDFFIHGARELSRP